MAIRRRGSANVRNGHFAAGRRAPDDLIGGPGRHGRPFVKLTGPRAAPGTHLDKWRAVRAGLPNYLIGGNAAGHGAPDYLIGGNAPNYLIGGNVAGHARSIVSMVLTS